MKRNAGGFHAVGPRLAVALLAGIAAVPRAAPAQAQPSSPPHGAARGPSAEEPWDLARPTFYDDSLPPHIRSTLEQIWYPRSLQDQADAVWREALRLRDAGRHDEARRMASELREIVRQAKDRLLPRADGKAELHVVVLHEGAYPEGKPADDPHPRGVAEVHVQFAGQPIVLVLSGHEPIKWRVQIDEDVRLRQVVLAGYSRQMVEGLPEGVSIRDESGRTPPLPVHTYRANHEPYYSRMMSHLREVTGLETATFQGARRYQGSPIVVGSGSQDWRVQLVSSRIDPLHKKSARRVRAEQRQRLKDLRFHAVQIESAEAADEKPARVFAEFTPLGPIATTIRPLPGDVGQVVSDPKTGKTYAARGTEIVEFDLVEGRAIKKLQHDRLRSCQLALDSKRRRLLVVTWTDGQRRDSQMHFIDVSRFAWQWDRGAPCNPLWGLTYSRRHDVYFAVSPLYASYVSGRFSIRALHRISPSGERLQPLLLEEPIPLFGSPFDGRVRLAQCGPYVAVLAPYKSERDGPHAPERSRCYLIDPTDGLVLRKLFLRPQAGQREFREGELEQLWESLSTSRGEQADRLMWRLADGGKQTVTFLEDKAATLTTPDRKRIVALIEQLDDDRFRVREDAYLQLSQMGRFAAAELARTAENPVSNEQAFRVGHLLEAIESGAVEPAIDRALRILVRNRSPEAIDLLTQLAGQQPDSTLSRLAAQALRQIDDEDELAWP